MASVADIQAALDPNGYGNQIRLIKQFRNAAGTTDLWYVVGNEAVVGAAGWVNSTVAQTTAQQATAITTATQAL